MATRGDNLQGTTSLAIAVAVLAAVSALAAWIPSRRAARVDPIVALRQDA